MTSPKINSTDIRTLLIDLLNNSICWLSLAVFLNGACKCILNGYAGSPYMQRGTPIGEIAYMFKSRRKPDSANIAASCIFPSEKKKIMQWWIYVTQVTCSKT